jgi:hypothetical protein
MNIAAGGDLPRRLAGPETEGAASATAGRTFGLPNQPKRPSPHRRAQCSNSRPLAQERAMRRQAIIFAILIILLIAALAGASLIPAGGAASTAAAQAARSGSAADTAPGGPDGSQSTGKLAPARTTCPDFANGRGADLSRALYAVRRGAVSSVAPGVFTYYSRLAAMPASFTIQVKQTRSPDLFWPWLPAQAMGQIVLYDAGCNRSPAQGATAYDPATGTITVEVSGAAGASYVLGIKYNPAAAKGAGASPPDPAVTYRFQTWIDGVAMIGSQAGLDMVFKK